MSDLRLTGKILKGVGGFYTVLGSDGAIFECKACGRFRKDGVTPLPGDNVLFTPESRYIEEILPRKNELIRPKVANVDLVAIVVSATKPNIDALLCDKLLVSAKLAKLSALLVINKCDAAETKRIESLREEYRNACPSVCVSALSGFGLDELREHLQNHCTCFAGQSAVGKSSLLNALFPGLTLKTDGMSKKTERGKHTTRHAELLVPEGFSGTVVDTPGFSLLECAEIPPEELWMYYDDMRTFASRCKYPSCVHEGEPQCAIKQAVDNGDINTARYQRYLEILHELEEKRNKKYD